MRKWIDLCETAISHKEYDLRARYDHWNKICFNGDLPPVPIRWGVMKSALGQAVCKYSIPSTNKKLPRSLRGTGAKVLPESLGIVMNKKYVRTERDFDAILIHEMIHILLYTKNDVTTLHEGAFAEKRKECEKLCGFPIPISEKIEDKVYADDIKIKPLVILLVERDGKETLYAILSPSAFDKIKGVIDIQWQERGEKNAALTAYSIASIPWMEKADARLTQRPKVLYGKGGVKFYYLVKDAEKYLTDLKTNGNVLFRQRNEKR